MFKNNNTNQNKINKFIKKIRSIDTKSCEDIENTILDDYSNIFGYSNILDYNKLNTKDEEEDLLDPNNRSFLAPIKPKYPDIWDSYKNQVASFWKAEELDFSEDYDDYLTLSDDEKHFVKMILAFFAASDGIVNFNISQRFLKEITNQEALYTYSYQMFIENIHSETYALMLDNIIHDEKEKDYLFNAIKNVNTIKKMGEWAFKWIDSSESFAVRLLSFIIVEGLFFSGAFAGIFWLNHYKNKNKNEGKSFMNGFVKSNNFISRDEGEHTNFGILMFKKQKNKPSRDKVYEIFKEGVELAKSFTIDAIPVKLIGMNNKSMCQYIEYVADRLLVKLGYNKIYKSSNPYSFMFTIGLVNKPNFFEERANQYSDADMCKRYDDTNINDLDLDEDIDF